MKFKFLAVALIPLALAACQSTTTNSQGNLAVSTSPAQLSQLKTQLTAYTWLLDTQSNKPMSLTLAEDGRYNIATTCNTLAGSWSHTASEIKTGNLITTMMACPESEMKQEGLAGQFFDQAKLSFNLDTSNVQAPTLTLSNAEGKRYVFTGKMTAETKYQGQAETIFLEISPETKPCTGVTAQNCLQVKEIKYNEKGLKTYHAQNWSNFYDNIEGFNHSANERQVIRVKRYNIKNPAADQSKYAYVYDMTVEREALKGTL